MDLFWVPFFFILWILLWYISLIEFDIQVYWFILFQLKCFRQKSSPTYSSKLPVFPFLICSTVDSVARNWTNWPRWIVFCIELISRIIYFQEVGFVQTTMMRLVLIFACAFKLLILGRCSFGVWETEDGLRHLGKAANFGHATAAYTIGLLFTCGIYTSENEKQLGFQLLEDVKARLGKGIVACRIKVKRFVERSWWKEELFLTHTTVPFPSNHIQRCRQCSWQVTLYCEEDEEDTSMPWLHVRI